MTWRERTLCRILFIIAMMLVDNDEVAKELHALATHISVSRDEARL